MFCTYKELGASDIYCQIDQHQMRHHVYMKNIKSDDIENKAGKVWTPCEIADVWNAS